MAVLHADTTQPADFQIEQSRNGHGSITCPSRHLILRFPPLGPSLGYRCNRTYFGVSESHLRSRCPVLQGLGVCRIYHAKHREVLRSRGLTRPIPVGPISGRAEHAVDHRIVELGSEGGAQPWGGLESIYCARRASRCPANQRAGSTAEKTGPRRIGTGCEGPSVMYRRGV